MRYIVVLKDYIVLRSKLCKLKKYHDENGERQACLCNICAELLRLLECGSSSLLTNEQWIGLCLLNFKFQLSAGYYLTASSTDVVSSLTDFLVIHGVRRRNRVMPELS